MEGLAPYGATIRDQAPEGAISPKIVVIVNWSDVMKGKRVKVDGPLCGGLYKEYHRSIVPWSGTDPDDKMN